MVAYTVTTTTSFHKGSSSGKPIVSVAYRIENASTDTVVSEETTVWESPPEFNSQHGCLNGILIGVAALNTRVESYTATTITVQNRHQDVLDRLRDPTQITTDDSLQHDLYSQIREQLSPFYAVSYEQLSRESVQDLKTLASRAAHRRTHSNEKEF